MLTLSRRAGETIRFGQAITIGSDDRFYLSDSVVCPDEYRATVAVAKADVVAGDILGGDVILGRRVVTTRVNAVDGPISIGGILWSPSLRPELAGARVAYPGLPGDSVACLALEALVEGEALIKVLW